MAQTLEQMQAANETFSAAEKRGEVRHYAGYDVICTEVPSFKQQKTGGSLTAFRNSDDEAWIWYDPGSDGSVTSFSKSGEGFSPRPSWKLKAFSQIVVENIRQSEPDAYDPKNCPGGILARLKAKNV